MIGVLLPKIDPTRHISLVIVIRTKTEAQIHTGRMTTSSLRPATYHCFPRSWTLKQRRLIRFLGDSSDWNACCPFSVTLCKKTEDVRQISTTWVNHRASMCSRKHTTAGNRSQLCCPSCWCNLAYVLWSCHTIGMHCGSILDTDVTTGKISGKKSTPTLQ